MTRATDILNLVEKKEKIVEASGLRFYGRDDPSRSRLSTASFVYADGDAENLIDEIYNSLNVHGAPDLVCYEGSFPTKAGKHKCTLYGVPAILDLKGVQQTESGEWIAIGRPVSLVKLK